MANLELKNIKKSFGMTEVLHDLNLKIEDKEFVVFVGPSGCGKSTLLRIIAGLEMATAGQILIEGQDVSNEHPVDRGISMVFQSYALYPHLTVFENIAFPLRVQKLPENEIIKRVGAAADILQLNERLKFKPGQLSGGQRQRVAIGRAIVRNPKIFLFDEPLSNLDAALRGDMRVELSRLHNQLETTMIYVTHDQVEAMTMADRIVVLKDGHIEQVGSPMELYHHPQTRFVASFIGQPNMNLLPVTVKASDNKHTRVELPGGKDALLPLDGSNVKAGDKIDIGLRPEDVTLAEQGAIAMNIDVLERLGGASIAYGNVDGHKFCASLEGTAIVDEDGTAYLSFEPSSVHAFDTNGKVLPRLQAPNYEIKKGS